jgi:formylglycine-generating enzyme required for sulfatase activity
MTELEFEKACRGTLAPVAGEYAWGSTAIGEYTGVLGVADKKPGSIPANASYGNHASVQGSVAVDLFETSSANRVANGTTYYGAYNMSGNVYERVVALGSKVGKKFNGSNGNGTLNAQGAADVPTWPGIDSEGSGFKGGTWYSSAAYLRVSDRSGANLSSAFRLNTTGGRGVRSEK